MNILQKYNIQPNVPTFSGQFKLCKNIGGTASNTVVFIDENGVHSSFEADGDSFLAKKYAAWLANGNHPLPADDNFLIYNDMETIASSPFSYVINKNMGYAGNIVKLSQQASAIETAGTMWVKIDGVLVSGLEEIVPSLDLESISSTGNSAFNADSVIEIGYVGSQNIFRHNVSLFCTKQC